MAYAAASHQGASYELSGISNVVAQEKVTSESLTNGPFTAPKEMFGLIQEQAKNSLFEDEELEENSL